MGLCKLLCLSSIDIISTETWYTCENSINMYISKSFNLQDNQTLPNNKLRQAKFVKFIVVAPLPMH